MTQGELAMCVSVQKSATPAAPGRSDAAGPRLPHRPDRLSGASRGA